ncbi:MAG: methyltransferase domain-containing protein, partial [Kiloniellales bacterium]|nr:methyltransferase domain-containing protein [Kiloniellales bacterium]
QKNELTKAGSCFRKATTLKPDYLQAFVGLAAIQQQRGNLKEAEAALQKASRSAGPNPEILVPLANIVREQGRIEEALSILNGLSARQPQLPGVAAALGDMLSLAGRTDEAIVVYAKAVNAFPDEPSFQQHLIHLLRWWRPSRHFGPLNQALVILLRGTGIEDQGISHVVAGSLVLDPDLRSLWRLAETDSENETVSAVGLGNLGKPLSNPLLLAAMQKMILPDRKIELALSALRRRFLAAIEDKCLPTAQLAGFLPFLLALAHYAFRCEYVFYTSSQEKRLLSSLRQGLLSANKGKDENDANCMAIVLFASYRPLWHEDKIAQLAEEMAHAAPSGFRRILEEQVIRPREEAEKRAEIIALTEIENDVSQRVHSQYDENPYPRWTSLYGLEPRPSSEIIGRELPQISPERLQKLTDPEILIAGCGTGRQAIYAAVAHANARVTAIDLSLTALAYGARMAERLSVTNIEFYQADILKLGVLEKRFDLIEAGGVLHHMDDPVKGLEVLTSLLKAHGLIKIALYSELARRHVVEAKALLGEGAKTGAPDDIRAARRSMLLDDADPAFRRITESSPDFYNLSNCRDLLFHVQERRFTVSSLRAALEDCGLKCEGFLMPPHADLGPFLKEFPVENGAFHWDALAAFEEANPDTFASMYLFWAGLAES